MQEEWEARVYARYVSVGKTEDNVDPGKDVSLSRPYVDKVVREHFPGEKDARVLELACGWAPFLYYLKQRGYSNLVGIDVSPEQVALAHRLGLQEEVRQGEMISFLEEATPNYYDVRHIHTDSEI